MQTKRRHTPRRHPNRIFQDSRRPRLWGRKFHPNADLNHRCDTDSIGKMNSRGILARKPGKGRRVSSRKTVARTHRFPEFSSMHHQGEIIAFWAAIRQPGFVSSWIRIKFSRRIQFTPWSTVCTPRQRALIRLDRSFR